MLTTIFVLFCCRVKLIGPVYSFCSVLSVGSWVPIGRACWHRLMRSRLQRLPLVKFIAPSYSTDVKSPWRYRYHDRSRQDRQPLDSVWYLRYWCSLTCFSLSVSRGIKQYWQWHKQPHVRSESVENSTRWWVLMSLPMQTTLAFIGCKISSNLNNNNNNGLMVLNKWLKRTVHARNISQISIVVSIMYNCCCKYIIN